METAKNLNRALAAPKTPTVAIDSIDSELNLLGVFLSLPRFALMTTYSIHQRLGSGSYSKSPLLSLSSHNSEIWAAYGLIGIVYEGKNSRGDAVAIKKSRVTTSVVHTLLKHEACAFVLLAPHKGFPRAHAWGRSQWFEYFAMDLLGPSLSDTLRMQGGRFNVGSVLLLAIQMARSLV
jgi:hypothetical protein